MKNSILNKGKTNPMQADDRKKYIHHALAARKRRASRHQTTPLPNRTTHIMLD